MVAAGIALLWLDSMASVKPGYLPTRMRGAVNIERST